VRQFQTTLEVRTPGRGLHEITRDIAAAVRESKIRTGLCVVFCRHTSASLVIQENADPTAKQDLLEWLGRIAPDGDARYSHDAEGPDDMAAHLRAAVTRTSETIPIVAGELALGSWQGVYLAEHRTRAHRRRIVVHLTGE
jgi:secondary thiamine-phosphate synthase enzyme